MTLNTSISYQMLSGIDRWNIAHTTGISNPATLCRNNLITFGAYVVTTPFTLIELIVQVALDIFRSMLHLKLTCIKSTEVGNSCYYHAMLIYLFFRHGGYRLQDLQ